MYGELTSNRSCRPDRSSSGELRLYLGETASSFSDSTIGEISVLTDLSRFTRPSERRFSFFVFSTSKSAANGDDVADMVPRRGLPGLVASGSLGDDEGGETTWWSLSLVLSFETLVLIKRGELGCDFSLSEPRGEFSGDSRGVAGTLPVGEIAVIFKTGLVACESDRFLRPNERRFSSFGVASRGERSVGESTGLPDGLKRVMRFRSDPDIPTPSIEN